MNYSMTEGSIGLSVGQMQSLLDKHEDTNHVQMKTGASEKILSTATAGS
jgi:hypothetical protein